MTNAISTGAAGRQRGDFTLEIDDQRASELYAGFDMASPLEQEQYRSALRNWAEQKVAQQQSATYDELQKVYEDVGAWWKDSGGNDAPDEVRYGAANRKFIAHQLQTTAREMGDLYPTYRDQWFLKTFRKQPKTEGEAFNTIRDMLAAQKQADETLVASGGQVALAAWEGKDPIAAVPDIVQAIKDANPEIAASLQQGAEAAWIKTLYDETKKTADVLQKHGETARQLYDLMVERTGAEVDNKSAKPPVTREESDALVDKLGEMSDEELDTVFTAIVSAAKASGMDEKTFWQQAGEANFSRFFNIFRSGGLQEPAAYDRLKYLENAKEILRPATDEERAAGQTDQRFAGTRFAALDRATAQVPMSEEERQQEIAKARKDLRRAEIYNKLIDLADNKFDPIQKKFSGLAGLAESVAYYGPQALMTSVATRIPAGIGPALMTYGIYQSEYRAMRQQGYSVEDARTLATYSAPFQMMVEYVSGGILLGRNKGVEEFLKRMANPAKAGAARRFGTRVAVNWPVEVAEESIQNFTTDGIQEALSALGEEYPDVDWEAAWTQYWDELPEIAAISLFPVMVVGGVLTFTDARSEKQRIEAFRQGGMSEDDIAEIRDSATVEEEVEKFRAKFWELDPERAKRGRDYIRSKIAERDRNRATGWTVDIEAGKGGQPTTYIVRDETGRVRLTTNDQTAADQIIVEESRRSVQAQFEQKTQELKEFVGWWLNEDPKRKDNEQRVAKDKQVTTAQQKLEILQQAGNAQGIKELHRRIAQSPYAGTPYDQIFILGEASVEQVGEMVFRSVIALNPNSDLRSAREEMHHTAVRIAAANGTVDEQTMRGWLEATERVFAEKGLGITLPRADMTDIVESMAVVQEAFENERISADVEMSLPQAFVAYIKRMVEVFVEVLKRGKAIREALDAGVLPAEFEAFLVETTGVADQTAVDRARERTEQEVGAQQNYSIGTPNYSIGVPTEVDEAAVYDSVLKLAGSRKWDRGRDLKMAMQEAVLSRAQAAGVDVSDMSPETKAYLVRVALRDALFALKQNPNAIGWYDIKTRQALAVMALIHPEIGTDENARFAFTWILAVTSNGLKVDMNFDLAEQVYRAYKKKKVMPTNVGIGTAGKAINNSLKLFNRLAKEWGIDNFRAFTQTTFKVSEISSIDKKLKPSGEFAATEVRGAAIAGPKIGNGFFSNLNGFFDALTMDRWLIRTWGRWTGTLIKAMPEQTTKATERLQKAVEALTSEQASELSAVIGMDIPTATMPDLAQALAKASMDKEIREALNNVSEELRKAGNSLAKYLDGQKEAPSGPAERNNVREIFQSVLDELRATEEYKDLTMADLQAVLWYAEKRLYESAKEDFVDDDETEGYADDEAPDYANAAAKVARDKGVSQARISKALTDTANVTAGGTRPPIGGSSGATGGQQGAAGGFTEGQKRLFRGNVAVRTVRRGRGSNAAPSWSYSREGSGDGGSVRVLKKIAVKYTASYKAGRDLRRVFRNNGIEAPRFIELVQDEANAQRFAELITASKKASKFGAAVYVYPVSDYQGMRLFLSEDGTTGFALKSNGDIVSVFSTGGAGHGALELAVAEGGTRLDAFDTILPDYYSSHGFVAVSRLNWDDSQAPDGWDKALYKEFNKGEPDVVFMAHQPSYFGWYSQNDGTVYTDYNDAVDAQDRAVADAATGANISTRNYSISTQSEIDRVQAAMGALDRSPLDTLEITEKLRKRFASIMAENMVELAAMRQGGVAEREVLDEEGNPIGPQPDAPRTKASGAEIRRTKLLQALGELDGLLSALPPQVAAKVGGYTVLTNIGTGDRALSNFFIKRLEMIDKELERYLKDRYTKALDELFKRAKPKRDEAGKTPKGKLGADIHALFDRLEEAVSKTAVEIDGEIASLEQQIASGELEPEQEAASILLSDALPLFGEWATADASRMAQAVQMGYDIFRVAYKKQKAKAILRKNLRDQERIDAKDASGAPDDTAPVRQKNKNEAEDFKSKAKGVVTNLLSFDQLMSLTFGRDSAFTKKWVNWQRKADNAKDDEFNAVYEQYAQFLATLTGHPKPYSMKATYAGQDLGYELALPKHKIKHTNVFGQEVEFEFSQADLMDITMMWMQPKGRAHMMGRLDDDGNPSGSDWHYDQSFIDKAERLLTDEAKAIRAFLLNDYAEQWASLNEVFVKLNDINLPQELFYSPLSVNPVQASQNQTIDALTGFPIAVPNRTPPSLRSRGAAVAEPVFSNAIDKWFAHRMQMAHWKAYAEFNNEALSVLGHRNVRNAVEAKLGPAGLVSLQHFITFFQQGGNRAADANLELTKALRGILGRAMTMSLFGRIGTVLIQFTQLGAAAAKMPVHAYLRRFFKLMSGQMGWGEAFKSPYIQRRIAQMPPQVQVAMAGLRANKPSQIREAARRVGWLLSGNDGLATAGTYAMVYDYQLEQMKKAGMTGAQAEAAAREEAERVTDEIAQPTRAGARSAFELSQTSPLQTVAWAFGSEPRKNLALLAYLQRAKRPLDEKGRALLYVLVFNGIFAALMRTMLRDLRDDEDDEIFDWDDTWNPKRLAMMVLTEPLYGVPVLGEMTEEAIFRAAREYRPEGSLYSVADPAFSLSRVPKHFSNLLEGEVDGRMVVKDINNILRGFGYVYPTAAGAAALSNLGKEFYEMGDTIFGGDDE